MEKLKNALLYAGVERISLERVAPKIRRANRIMGITLSAIGALLMGSMLILSFYIESLMQNRAVYMYGVAFSAIVLLLAILAKKYDYLVTPLVYFAYAIYYLYGIFIGTVTEPEGKTVTFMVMLVFMPTLFINRPIRILLITTVYSAVFIILCMITKVAGPVRTIDIIDAVLFGILGIASGVVVNYMKIRGYVDAQKIQEISRIDQLTQVNNRNAFELDLFSITNLCRHSLACVYIDVNGLRKTNNTRGHKQGDIMLKLVAEKIKEAFSNGGATYRIGGDEFVVFAPDTSRADIGYTVFGMTKQIEESGYHVAVGYEVMNLRRLDVEELIKSAEVSMYRDKKQFYKNLTDKKHSKKAN